jgi:hypothetical protein
MDSPKTNHLDIDERVARGIAHEERILQLLNEQLIFLRRQRVKQWASATISEDIADKIDAWATLEDGTKLSAQIKYRESGADVGVAVLMPFINHEALLGQYEFNKLPWDRDMRSKAELMVCLSAGGSVLTVSEMHLVKRAVDVMLSYFVTTGYFDGRNFVHEDCPGVEFKVVTDQGRGYSAGKKKLVCYIAPALLESAGAFVHRYYGKG